MLSISDIHSAASAIPLHSSVSIQMSHGMPKASICCSNSVMNLAMRRVSGLYDETISIHSRSGVSCERTNRGANSMQRHNSPQPGLITLFRFINSILPRRRRRAPYPEPSARRKHSETSARNGEIRTKIPKKIENNPPVDRSMPKQTVFAWLAERNRHIRRNRSSATTALWSLTSSCGM